MRGAQAELPPSAYQERQEQAPEALVIKVKSVQREEVKGESLKEVHFTVAAEVQKVERTATGLTPGTMVEIRYTQRQYSKPIAGPSEVPALAEGKTCPAYLRREGRFYTPAAGGYSFETVR
jgi:hypothetical protein